MNKRREASCTQEFKGIEIRKEKEQVIGITSSTRKEKEQTMMTVIKIMMCSKQS